MSQASQWTWLSDNPLTQASAPAAAPPPPAPPIPPITEEEKKSLLEKLGSAGLGGLSAVAGAVNKPGRAVRGLLGGNLREALNVIPFSDSLGITDPSQEIHGHDLLRNLGVTDEKDPSLFSPAGAAGFGVDVLTDPLTYLSFGGHALTKAGLAAKKAYTLAPTVAERVALGQGGHIGVGLPLMGNAATFDLAPVGNAINSAVRAVPGGNALADAAGQIGGAVGDLYSRTIPPLFQNAVRGQTEPIAQAEARAAEAARPGVTAAARGRVNALTGDLPSVQAGGLPTLEEGRGLRQAMEQVGPGNPADPLTAAANARSGLQAENLQNLNHQGFPDLPLADQIGYAGRELTAPPVGGDAFNVGATRGMKPAGQGAARDQIFKTLETEGPGSLNALSRDTALLPLREQYNAGNKVPFTDVVKEQYLKVDPTELTNLKAAVKAGATHPDVLNRLGDLEARAVQAEHLADYVATKVDPKLALDPRNLGMFDVHPDITLVKNTVKTANRVLDSQALHNSVAKLAVAGTDGVPLSKVLTDAGLTYRDASGNLTAMQRTMEAMQKLTGKLPANATLADLDNFSVPIEAASKLSKFTQATTAPAGMQPFLKIWDSITNLTKAFQTTFWPANRVRNGGQAVFMNYVVDGFSATAKPGMGYVKPYIDSMAWHGGQTIEDISKWPAYAGMTDEVASKKFASLVDNLGVASAFRGPDADVIGSELGIRQLLPTVPGQARKGFGQIVKDAVPANPLRDAKQFRTDINPLGAAGVGGRTEDTNTIIKAGRDFGTEQHAVDRVATFAAKMSQGYTPEAALAEVNAAHYNFANQTRFEKDVMRRVVPFYCVPDNSDALTRDGWKTCDQLVVGEEVLTHNLETDVLEWQPCTGKAIFDYNEEILTYRSKRKTFSFTPNHRWPVRIQGQKNHKRPYGKGVYNYPAKTGVVIGEELNGSHSFIQNAECFSEDSVLTPEQARRLGWILTDGYHRHRGNHTEAMVYQSPKKFLRQVCVVAGGKPRKPHPQSGVVCVPVLNEWTKELKQYLDKKNLINVVTRLSRAAAEAMYEAMYQAEGVVSVKRQGLHFAATKQPVRDAFRVLAFMLGKTTTESKAGCYVSHRRYLKVGSGEITSDPYFGRVWCTQTPNGTWVMRQNGVILITGNSFMRQNVPAVVSEVLENPGGKMAMTMRAANAAKGDNPGFTPSQLSGGIAAKLGDEQNGQQRYLTHLGLGFEDLGNLLGPGGPLGALNPLIKAPVEAATGKQLISGRDLADLHSRVGEATGITPPPMIENLLMNSPVGRMFSAVGTARDDRKSVLDKAVNLGTGVRVSDVDVDASRRRAVLDAITNQLHGPNVNRFESLSVRPDQFAQMNPFEQHLFQLYRNLNSPQGRLPASTLIGQ